MQLGIHAPISHLQSKKGARSLFEQNRPHNSTTPRFAATPGVCFLLGQALFLPRKTKTSSIWKVFHFCTFFSRRATFALGKAMKTADIINSTWNGKPVGGPTVDFELRSCCILMMISRTSFSLFREGGFFLQLLLSQFTEVRCPEGRKIALESWYRELLSYGSELDE